MVLYFDTRFKRDASGKLVISPGQAIETYQDAANPTPDVAGLRWVLERLLELPESHAGAEQRAVWTRLLAAVPALPTGDRERREDHPAGGQDLRRPGQLGESRTLRRLSLPDLRRRQAGPRRRPAYMQSEVPRRHGLASGRHASGVPGPDRQGGRARRLPGRQPRRGEPLSGVLGTEFRLDPRPGPRRQPDDGARDHALAGRRRQESFVLPAWPKSWDVEFKLHAGRTTVEGVYRSGKFESLKVTPERPVKVCPP